MTRQARLPYASLWCVVLAAGGSSRLGRPKQLVRRRMRTLLLDTCSIAHSIAPRRTVVVLGAQALRLRRMLHARLPGLSFVNNSAWQHGMGSSLLAGLAHLPRGCGAALVLLCDQPAVRTRQLEKMMAAWQRRPRLAAASRYGDGVGVPAVLPRKLWSQLSAGDRGARDVLRRQNEITIVALPEAEVDLDTPTDLENLEQRIRTLRRVGPWRS